MLPDPVNRRQDLCAAVMPSRHRPSFGFLWQAAAANHTLHVIQERCSIGLIAYAKDLGEQRTDG